MYVQVFFTDSPRKKKCERPRKLFIKISILLTFLIVRISTNSSLEINTLFTHFVNLKNCTLHWTLGQLNSELTIWIRRESFLIESSDLLTKKWCLFLYYTFLKNIWGTLAAHTYRSRLIQKSYQQTFLINK